MSKKNNTNTIVVNSNTTVVNSWIENTYYKLMKKYASIFSENDEYYYDLILKKDAVQSGDIHSIPGLIFLIKEMARNENNIDEKIKLYDYGVDILIKYKDEIKEVFNDKSIYDFYKIFPTEYLANRFDYLIKYGELDVIDLKESCIATSNIKIFHNLLIATLENNIDINDLYNNTNYKYDIALLEYSMNNLSYLVSNGLSENNLDTIIGEIAYKMLYLNNVILEADSAPNIIYGVFDVESIYAEINFNDKVISEIYNFEDKFKAKFQSIADTISKFESINNSPFEFWNNKNQPLNQKLILNEEMKIKYNNQKLKESHIPVIIEDASEEINLYYNPENVNAITNGDL